MCFNTQANLFLDIDYGYDCVLGFVIWMWCCSCGCDYDCDYDCPLFGQFWKNRITTQRHHRFLGITSLENTNQSLSGTFSKAHEWKWSPSRLNVRLGLGLFKGQFPVVEATLSPGKSSHGQISEWRVLTNLDAQTSTTQMAKSLSAILLQDEIILALHGCIKSLDNSISKGCRLLIQRSKLKYDWNRIH